MVRFALNLKYLSETAYKAVRESGMINLPSERTLFDYSHWGKESSGVFNDGISVCRLVSFDTDHKTKLQKKMESGESISLQNCLVKKGKGL